MIYYHKDVVNDVLANWARWCRGGWPYLLHWKPPTSTGYVDRYPPSKPPPRVSIDDISGEAANTAIVNLALAGDTRSYQIIADWWAHGRPAKAIARDMHCSLASVYNWRGYAMESFWLGYQGIVRAQRRPYLTKVLATLEKKGQDHILGGF